MKLMAMDSFMDGFKKLLKTKFLSGEPSIYVCGLFEIQINYINLPSFLPSSSSSSSSLFIVFGHCPNPRFHTRCVAPAVRLFSSARPFAPINYRPPARIKKSTHRPNPWFHTRWRPPYISSCPPFHTYHHHPYRKKSILGAQLSPSSFTSHSPYSSTYCNKMPPICQAQRLTPLTSSLGRGINIYN